MTKDALHSPSMARMLNLSPNGSTKKSANMPSAYMSSAASGPGGVGAGFGYQGQPYGSGWARPMQASSQPPAMRTAQRDAGGAGQAHSVARGGSPWMVANAAGGPHQRQPRAAGKMD